MVLPAGGVFGKGKLKTRTSIHLLQVSLDVLPLAVSAPAQFDSCSILSMMLSAAAADPELHGWLRFAFEEGNTPSFVRNLSDIALISRLRTAAAGAAR